MEDEIEKFISELVEGFSGVSSIWLIGSRANGTAKPSSDWDFIVFADATTFEKLKIDEHFHHDAVDLLVVTDGNSFEKPWGDKKSGSLSDWEWKEISQKEAIYKSGKIIPDKPGSNMGNIEKKQHKAHLLYRALN